MSRNPGIRPRGPSAEGVDKLGQRRGVRRDPLEDLRLLLAESRRPLNARSLLLILSRVLSHSRNEAKLQRCEGYMSEVLEKWPRWDRRVAVMRSETTSSRLSADRRMASILRELPSSGVVEQLPSFVQQWMQSLAAIRRHESSLLQRAFTLDLGGEA